MLHFTGRATLCPFDLWDRRETLFKPKCREHKSTSQQHSCTQSPQTVGNDLRLAWTLLSTLFICATTIYHPTRPKMASNSSTATYELVFHPPVRRPTSPKGHTSLASAQAARGTVLYQRTNTPSPPIQGKNALHIKLVNLNQPTPIGPLNPNVHTSNLYRAMTALPPESRRAMAYKPQNQPRRPTTRTRALLRRTDPPTRTALFPRAGRGV